MCRKKVTVWLSRSRRVAPAWPRQAQLSRNLSPTVLLNLVSPNHPLPFSRVEAGSDNKQLDAAGTVDGLGSVVAAGALRGLPPDILNRGNFMKRKRSILKIVRMPNSVHGGPSDLTSDLVTFCSGDAMP